MKLTFNSIVIGGGANYFLISSDKGLNPDLDNVMVKIPRTDYGKSVTDHLALKLRSFDCMLVGDDAEDYRDKKRALKNFVRNSYTFQLDDETRQTNGSFTTYASYEFTGKIVAVDFTKEFVSHGNFMIQIACDDPFLYLLPAESDSITITTSGTVFPLVFPLVFSGVDNSLIVTNSGGVPVYPTITITGPGTEFVIINEDSDLDNKQFIYSATLLLGETLIITPVPNDPIKVRKNGVSVIQYSNSNFEALKLGLGESTLTFIVGSNNTAATSATVSFKSPFIGI